jgi:hypothetical protein
LGGWCQLHPFESGASYTAGRSSSDGGSVAEDEAEGAQENSLGRDEADEGSQRKAGNGDEKAITQTTCRGKENEPHRCAELTQYISQRKAAIKMRLFQPSVTTGNNRTSTEAALRTLSAQIRANIKRELKETDHLGKELENLKKKPRGRVVQMHIKELEVELAKHPKSIREVFERLDVDGNGALGQYIIYI